MSIRRYDPRRPNSVVMNYAVNQAKKAVVNEMLKSANRSYYGTGGYLNPGYWRGKKRAKNIYGKKGKGAKRKTNQRLSSDVKRLQGKITKLKRLDDATTGTLTYRRGLTYRSLSAVNSQAVYAHMTANTTLYETAMAQTKYFNPAVPGTLTTGSSVSGTYQRNIMVDYIGMSLDIRNNYQSPADVTVYLCNVKDDTNSSPSTAWTNAIADGSNLSANTELNQFPTDYNLVNDLWKLSVHRQVRLEPGDTCRVKHSETNINYDPATVDSHNLSFQKEYKSFGFLVVVKGIIAHDSVVDEQGLAQAGVDVERIDTIKIKYAAGINIAYTYIDNSAYDSFTNGALVSNKPANGQQAYSL